MTGLALLEVVGLHVDFPGGREQVVKGISFTLARGECLALIGESGCGKSVTLRTIAGLTGPGAVVRASRLAFDGADMARFSATDWRRVRGARLGFVLQDAMASLDPLRRVGDEIAEPLRLHQRLGRAARQAKVEDLLRDVGVPEPAVRAAQYPHQLSGGLRQRALIASAIACAPDLLLADEPTTALDALAQAQVLDLLASLRARGGAMLIVSHDLAVAARLADRVAVMQAGRFVEYGPTEAVLRRPQHHYTVSLVAAGATVHARARPEEAAGHLEASTPAVPEIEARGVTKSFVGRDGIRRIALQDASVVLWPGRTLGIVGGSGSGKTTLTRILLGLETPDDGAVLLRGQDWRGLAPAARRAARRRVQVVFQDPLSSFDPRYSVWAVLEEALAVAGDASRDRAAALLELVRLSPDCLPRRPAALSGGQRQRLAIARALATGPAVLICDEPVSALDVSVQARILDLLAGLQERLQFACLLISHDLGVIRRMSDDIAVIEQGRIVEAGTAGAIFAAPSHAYTGALMAAIPKLQP
jgi:peptide/nickel transport system ATP-binding protein